MASETPQKSQSDNDTGVLIEFIPVEDVPAEHRAKKDFRPGHQAIVMRHAQKPDGPALYFTETEWAGFVDDVKHGEFDDLLDGLDGSSPQDEGLTPQ